MKGHANILTEQDANILNVFLLMSKKTFRTGSTQFALKNPHDEDWVCTEKEWKRFNKVYKYKLSSNGDYSSEYNFVDVYIFKTPLGVKLDVIVINAKEYKVWKKSTKTMKRIIKSSKDTIWDDKVVRTQIFELLKSHYRNLMDVELLKSQKDENNEGNEGNEGNEMDVLLDDLDF